MKIALFSDVHANLPALEACLNDIATRKPDAIFCLGDLVGYNIWPNEVIQEIRKRNIPTIAGNYDYGVGRNSDDCGCAYKTDEEKAMGNISISFTNDIIHDDEREYLKNLPAHIRLEYKLDNEQINLLLVHGSPRRVNEYLFEDRNEKSLLRIMNESGSDIMCFGHTHLPYHRILSADDNNLHAINIGSVGRPKDGNPKGCYVMLELNDNSNLSDPASIKVEIIRFDYDVEKAAVAVENSPLPNAYATTLRTGF